MLTPSILQPCTPFDGVGSTPAVSLTRCIPHGVDADVLLLGCGDVRHVLCTAHHEKGLPPRKLDITFCHVEDAIVARNVLFLTFVTARGKSLGPRLCWDLYYHLFLDDESVHALQEHLTRLLELSASSPTWKAGEFGTQFRFSTDSTLSTVRAVWEAYAEAIANKSDKGYRAKFEAAVERSKEYSRAVPGSATLRSEGARAAAPLGAKSTFAELRKAIDSWWETGVTGSPPSEAAVPNPLFSTALSEHHVLAFGSNPILSHHLAAARVRLAEPLSLPPTDADHDQDDDHWLGPGFVNTVRRQFAEWITSFTSRPSSHLVLRFVSADYFAFCHTLQHNLQTGKFSNNFYRRQLSAERLELDGAEYAQPTTPKTFDVIDAFNSSDDVGALNILVAASPLLKDAPWATLYTETMSSNEGNGRKKFEKLLGGSTTAVSTLLGISPTEYWTNATALSAVDDYMQAIAAGVAKEEQSAIPWRFAWKFNKHLSAQPSTQLPKVKDTELAALIYNVYQSMFIGENPLLLLSLSQADQKSMVTELTYPKYHRGSLVAFLKRLFQMVDVDKRSVCKHMLEKLMSSSAMPPSVSDYSQYLSLEMSCQGLYTEPWLTNEIHRGINAEPFSGWPHVPNYVAITVSIPASRWKQFYDVAAHTNSALTVEGSVRRDEGGPPSRNNIFSDVQISFGKIKTSGIRGSSEFSVDVLEDKRRWLGDSAMIASFHVPTAVLLQVDPKGTKVGLNLHENPHTVSVFKTKLQLGHPPAIYETDLDDADHVYVTQHLPGQNGFPIFNSRNMVLPIPKETDDSQHSFTINLNASGDISTVTGRLDILSGACKRLLAEKATVNVQKISPFVFEIALGEDEVVFTLTFPVPVAKDGSKTRVARTSSYIEIIAPLADPATSQALDDFIYPSILANAAQSSNTGQPMPVPLNIPHVNLDTLPILDITDKEALGFLGYLAAWSFSARERKLRDEADNSGLATSSRMNFKESLFTMFMLASGLQGGQTGLFAINHPQKGGIHMLIFVSALRLDGASGSVVLDAAALPLTLDIIKEGRLDSFLLILRTLECCSVTVNDEELILWKKTLPSLVERCRNWSHTVECEYAQRGATVPLSTEPAKQVICGCGAGKLPQNFINLPEWNEAATYATRVAISPTYAVPFVEEVIDPEMLKGVSSATADAMGDHAFRCRNCGKTEARGGGALKKCMRCLRVRYCSAECQKKDWKKHRMECEEAEEYNK